MRWRRKLLQKTKGKHNVILTPSNETNTKNSRNSWLKTNQNVFFETALQKLPIHIEDGQFKYLKHNLNSMNEFNLSFMMSFLGSRFKILKMSWYTSMKPFQTNLEIVIKKYLCCWRDSLPRAYSSSNDQTFSVMSKYISSYN